MNPTRTHIRRYRFNDFEVEKLELLKQYRVKESKFVRKAIDEKLERDYPNDPRMRELFKLNF